MRGEGAADQLRVLIVSDQAIVRAGIAASLRPFRSRTKVVGEVAGVEAALSEAARSLPHVVLFGSRLGAADGLDQVAHLTEMSAGFRVVVLAPRDEARFTWLVLQRGAAGFLLETVTGSELVQRLEEVHNGTIVVDSTLAGGGAGPDDAAVPPWPGFHLGLTERESQILELLAHGAQTSGVGRQLGLSQGDVKVHIRSAYRRLQVRDRRAALARLAREGLFC